MRLLPSIALASMLFAGTAARAEDFTGFYAGLNAGYASGRGSEREGSAPSPAVAPPSAETGLPPSALSAAERLEEKRPGARRAGAR